jgi:hypothetical protein
MQVNINKISYITHKTSGTLEEYRGQLVGKLIRKKYLLNDELAIQRKRDTRPDEFNAYNLYADECVAAVDKAFEDMEISLSMEV